MFEIYGIDGVHFRGTLEELEDRRLSIRRRPPAKAISGEPDRQDFKSTGSSTQSRVNREGLAAYLEILGHKNIVEPLIHIEQIMSHPVATIDMNKPISEAWQQLRNNNWRQLAAVNDQRRLAGVISDRDILHHINIIDELIEIGHDAPVEEVMPKETITCQALSDIRRVAKVMAFSHLDAMIVFDGDEMVGIVTRGDILRGFAEHPKLNLWA